MRQYRSRITDYSDVIMSSMTSQITGVLIVYSTICSGADQRKHQSSASLAIVRGIHRWPVNSQHKGPVTRKMFPIDYVIMVNIWDWNLFTMASAHIRVLYPCVCNFYKGADILLCVQWNVKHFCLMVQEIFLVQLIGPCEILTRL